MSREGNYGELVVKPFTQQVIPTKIPDFYIFYDIERTPEFPTSE